MVGALVSAVVGPPAWVPPLILVAVAAAGVTWALWRAEKREEES